MCRYRVPVWFMTRILSKYLLKKTEAGLVFTVQALVY
jgi:hypothetical protein